MPRASLSAGAHRDDSSIDRFDKLKLDTGEEARLWFPNEDLAWMEHVHTLRGPVFEESGEPLMTTKDTKSGSREVYKTDFIARRICAGDPEVLKLKGLDPENCVICAGLKRMMDNGITEARDMLAQRRFAVPVVRYKLAKKTDADGKLYNPPSAEILVWSLSQWTYNKVDDVRAQQAELLNREDVTAENVKLQMTDICVHCESGMWQTLTRVWPKRRAWSQSDTIKDVIQTLWNDKSNRPTDDQLKAECGRDYDLEWTARDIEDTEERWERAVHYGEQPPAAARGQVAGGSSAEEDLDSLLDDEPTPPAAGTRENPGVGGLEEFAPQEDSAASAGTGDDLFGEDSPAAAAPAASAPAADAGDDLFGSDDAPAADKVPASVGAGSSDADLEDFDNILKD